MTMKQARERDERIREAERTVIEAAKEWDENPTNEALCLLLSEAVHDLKEAEK